MQAKINDPLYRQALQILISSHSNPTEIKEVISGKKQIEIPTMFLGTDPETDRPRNEGRAKRALRKYVHDLNAQGLSKVKLEGLLEDCKVPA